MGGGSAHALTTNLKIKVAGRGDGDGDGDGAAEGRGSGEASPARERRHRRRPPFVSAVSASRNLLVNFPAEIQCTICNRARRRSLHVVLGAMNLHS